MSKIPTIDNVSDGGEHSGMRCSTDKRKDSTFSIITADQLGIEQWEYEALSAIHRDNVQAITDCAARLRLRLT